MKILIYTAIAVLMLNSCMRIDAHMATSEQYNTAHITNAKTQILNVMKTQERAWNNHDIEGFMQGYWKSDSLKFYGRNGLTKGWQNTLDNYNKSYPTKADTGTLNFSINDISPLSDTSYWVMGEYHLTREAGNASGVFMIIFKYINGQWKIIADMSC